jgi:3-hydroxyacyl-[acyl-carrier-protein] dehydratase
MDLIQKILNALPYGADFRFVDAIDTLDPEHISGHYTFQPGTPYYQSHFLNQPRVPGVLMIECMGQIGMVCHLAFLSGRFDCDFLPVLSNVEATFHASADFGERCIVTGTKIYYRKQILKSAVEMRKADGTLIAALTANIMMTERNA